MSHAKRRDSGADGFSARFLQMLSPASTPAARSSSSFVAATRSGARDVRRMAEQLRQQPSLKAALQARRRARDTGCLHLLADALLEDLEAFEHRPRVLREVVQIAIVGGRRKALAQRLRALRAPWSPYVLAQVETLLPGPLDVGSEGEA